MEVVGQDTATAGHGRKAIVLFPSAFFPHFGGVEEVSMTLARGLMKRDYRVIVVTNRHPEELSEFEVVDGIPVYRFKFKFPSRRLSAITQMLLGLRALIQLLLVLKRNRPQVLHLICASTNTLYAYIAKQVLNIPVVVSLHGETFADSTNLYEKSRFARWSLRALLQVCNAVTGCSQIVIEDAQAKLALALTNAQVIANGIDMTLGNPDSRTNLGLGGRKFILSVGRLASNKGFNALLRAFRMIAHRFGDVDLVIIGDGPEMSSLEKLRSELELDCRVHLIGKVAHSELMPVYQECQFFVCPSPIESFGLACLEAMSAGKAVIATNRGGPSEFISPDEGILIDTTDVNHLAGAMSSLLSDPLKSQRLGEEAVKKARLYNWDEITKQYIGLYETVVPIK